MHTALSAREIVRRFGGAAELARLIGLDQAGERGPSQVRMWVKRGRIPGAYFARIATAARKGDIPVTLEDLAALADEAA